MKSTELHIPNVQVKTVKKIKRWETPYIGYLFMAPWLIGLFVFILWPMGLSLYYSFTNFSLLAKPTWIGAENYSQIIIDDDKFLQSLKVTLQFVVFSVPLKLIFALLVAMLLRKEIKGMSFYRTFIYFPSLIGTSIAVSILWRQIFGQDGFINHLLSYFHIAGKSWIGDPSSSLGTLIILAVWQFGSTMVIFLAGLKQIPNDLYEASSVDGASKFRQFISITLPMLSPILLFNLVLATIQSFQMFTQAFIITKGGPANSTYMYALYLYERAFDQLQMGYASALAWVLLIVIGVATALIFVSSKYWVFYESETGGKQK
ncbi:ABC transporter permease [Paenibacillus ferrarius]|uniref:ABC transporter permease n=1 Tax=Paenibacillus ferrarius TaxID=1469647 RepID=A0A1V4HMS3_9BACL|nr:sugar ABC transporter permease [Paenibacillus ferrarius]OPH58425.1 ABC transporter permease [Paenibacillus ferrarius]